MIGLVLSLVWLIAMGLVLLSCAAFERRARLVARPDRPDLEPPRARWGGGPLRPPAHAAPLRALAGFARLVRPRSAIVDHRPGLRLAGRVGALTSLVGGLAMLPMLGTWGGGEHDPPLLLLDLPHGLAAIALLILLGALFRVSIGLSERNVWARIGSVRQSSRAIAALALLSLVLAPLAIGSGTLRLHEIVLDQQRAIGPVVWLLSFAEGEWADTLRAWPLPAWNLFTQPLTAILFVPAISLLLGSARVDDPTTAAVGAAGLGLDSDPLDTYWSRLDARLSLGLAAALFVTLFLGGSSVPFVDFPRIVGSLEAGVGYGLPRFLLAALMLGSFLAKCVFVIAVVARCKRFAASARVDRSLRLVTRRLLPLAWANLLLVSALALWWAERAGGLGS